MNRREILQSAIFALIGSTALEAHASRREPMRIIMPFAAGGSGDSLARLVAAQVEEALDRPVIVENKPGADGRIGIEAAKKATPDGSTLLVTPIAPMSVYPHVYKSLPYDPFLDFRPISQLATFEFGIAVGPDVPASNVGELVAWLKANPAKTSYGTPAAGTLPHFFAVMFAQAAGLAMTHVPYRGSGMAINDLVGGHIPMVFSSNDGLSVQHKAGRIRVLATSGLVRSPFLPDVPTFREAGYDIEGVGWFGLFAPARTPDHLVHELSDVVVNALRRHDVRERVLALGLQPTGTAPERLGEIQRADAEGWAPAVRASGFSADK
jgi:tripartite-type tricarboxylate transporter receptor subunit TctC